MIQWYKRTFHRDQNTRNTKCTIAELIFISIDFFLKKYNIKKNYFNIKYLNNAFVKNSEIK